MPEGTISDSPVQHGAAIGYPALSANERSRWVMDLRGPKNVVDPWQPYVSMWEEEADSVGGQIPTATIFLTNRECPYRCLMCDLWQNTLDVTVPMGAIPAQIEHAVGRLPAARQVKLYNAGSFFDPRAIPPSDYAAIAGTVAGFERVVVECHPALIGRRILPFRDLLDGRRLEVAIGLETVHPQVLDRLNKRFTVDDFRRAADFLAHKDIALRVFILLRPPFMGEDEGLEWAKRSLDVAFDCGAEVCCIIPTRGGNGAMEALAAGGQFAPPSLQSLESAQEYGLGLPALSRGRAGEGVGLRRGRVFSDLWDVEKFYTDDRSPARASRLAEMNRTQRIPPTPAR